MEDFGAPGELRFATLRGVPSETAPSNDEVFYLPFPVRGWGQVQRDLAVEVDEACFPLYDAFIEAIFGDLDEYRKLVYRLPMFVSEAGLGSESAISKEQFEGMVTKAVSPLVNTALYISDCHKVISGIQECAKEVSWLEGEFYRSLNFDELFPGNTKKRNGVHFVSSTVTNQILSDLYFIFIRLYSLLDYTTKLFYEIEHLNGLRPPKTPA